MSVRTGGLLLAGAAVLLSGCDGTAAAGRAGSTPAPSSSSATPTPTPSPTPPPKLEKGDKGRHVKYLQRRLKQVHYDPGKIDGRYGTTTEMAVWAFKEVNDLKPNDTIGKRTWAALKAPQAPEPLTKKKREPDRVDVDIDAQYLVVYRKGRPVLITHISSGSGEYYCAKDRGATVARCRYATTGTGDFTTGRRVSGWETSPLGRLYNPIYFNGGIAFHGAPSVPNHPASHGCVRLPMHVAEYFPDLVGDDVPVHVRDPG